MRDALKGMVIGVILLAVLGAVATRAGWIATSLPRPQGTGAWMLSRATGLLAYTALGLGVVIGLLISTRIADRVVSRAQLVALHGWLSPLALTLVLAHAGILLADNYVRFDIVDIVIPFASSRSSFAIGLGVLSGYLVLAVHLSFGLRKRIGTATWRRFHYLSFVAFILVTIHALAAGTDRATIWFALVYGVMLFAIVSLVLVRIRRARPGT